MKEEEPIDEYAGKLNAMSVRYSNLGGTLDDAAMVKKLFDTVPERFLSVVAGIEQFYDLKELLFEEAVGRLKAFEERVQRGAGGSGAKTDSKGQLLLTHAEWEARQSKVGGEASGRGRLPDGGGRGPGGRGRGRGRGRGGRGDAPGRDSAAKKNKEHIQCFNCKDYGHYANRCPKEKKGGGEEAHHA